MFRGSAPARVDEKGRVKIPSQYREVLEKKKYGDDFFVTSIDGEFARIYPLPIWVDLEKKLVNQPTFDPRLRKLKEALTYYGAEATMDGQGRILIPGRLRERAKIVDEVSILGQLTYLDIWNQKKLDDRITSQTFTDEDFQALSDKGF